ncbi:MAG: DUF1573 domain-containing protein [Bacteroidales bacterium]|nr:DUF1573 domain-containing protein [Bacteroidales bacterium]
MEKIRTIVILVCLCLPLAAGAQGSALLRFTEPEQAVDTVRFDSGAITLRYPYENVSGQTVTILEVHSTCGCFTGKVDTRSLRPGGKGVLVAVFDPKSLYGDQTRYLTVVTTDGTDNVLNSIAVKGYVLRDESEGKIRYAEDLGQGLRTDTSVNALAWDSFGDFAFSIPLYNDTDEEMTLQVTGPRRVKLYAPATIPARSRVDLRGVYDARWKRLRTEVTETLTITVNGVATAPLHIKGTL